jgi:hypothetical protein
MKQFGLPADGFELAQAFQCLGQLQQAGGNLVSKLGQTRDHGAVVQAISQTD